jgi:hypothetical protein
MATSTAIRISEDGALLCPACGAEGTHMEIVYIAARREDEEVNEITVSAVTGQIRTREKQSAPAGPAVGDGRRHRIAITGHCEGDGEHKFAVVFTQHKGWTFMEAVTPIPHETDGDPQPEVMWQNPAAHDYTIGSAPDPWSDPDGT